MLVHKYGGSSVATTKQIMDIAEHLKNIIKKENRKLVIVVSAMGKTTNGLIEKANEITSKPTKREMDALLSCGEGISAPLLAIALNDLDIKAISLNGTQAGFKTYGDYSKSYIKSIDTKKIKKLFQTYNVIVITGFQGINKNGDITTLGRGGSDTTAVALACALKCPCEIYTDVEHIYTFDPRIISSAKPIKEIGYEEMNELSLGGAKVLEPRSVELAKNYNIPIYLGKSLEKTKKGSFVMKRSLESEKVSSLALKENISILTIKANIENKDFLNNLLSSCKKELSTYSLLSYLTIDTNQIVSISLDELEAKNLIEKLENLNILNKSTSLEINNLSKIVIAGVGFVTHPELTNKIVNLLNSQKITINNLNVNEFSLSLTVEKANALKTISIICEKFNL